MEQGGIDLRFYKFGLVLILSILALVLDSRTTVVAQSSISSAIGWSQIPNTQLQNVCEDGVNTCGGILAWSGAVLDTLRNRFIIWGGGHHDYAGNEIYALNLTGTPNFQLIWPHSNEAACNLYSCDGGLTPNSRHTYNGLAYMANVDRLFVYSGGLSGAGAVTNDTWTFDFKTLTWQYMNPTVGPDGGPLPNISTAVYDPNTGLVFVNDCGSLYSYNFSTNTYTKVSGPGFTEVANDYHLFAVIDAH